MRGALSPRLVFGDLKGISCSTMGGKEGFLFFEFFKAFTADTVIAGELVQLLVRKLSSNQMKALMFLVSRHRPGGGLHILVWYGVHKWGEGH